MDGMLSQDEINALLNGIDLSEAEGDADDAADESGSVIDDSLLTEEERDAIGEIANISMGSSATTLYSLVNRKVDITTPKVSLSDWAGVVEGYERPCVFIQIKYTAGLDGSNILVLKEHDVKVITDLMMAGSFKKLLCFLSAQFQHPYFLKLLFIKISVIRKITFRIAFRPAEKKIHHFL